MNTESPPTAQAIAEKTDEIFAELLAMPASCFMAGELMWAFHWYNKPRWSTSAEQEQSLQNQVNKLKTLCLSRQASR